MGLNPGIYNDLGNMTCAGYLGSSNYLCLDAQVRIAQAHWHYFLYIFWFHSCGNDVLCLSPAFLLLAWSVYEPFLCYQWCDQLEAILTLFSIPLCGKLKTIEYAESQRAITKGQSQNMQRPCSLPTRYQRTTRWVIDACMLANLQTDWLQLPLTQPHVFLFHLSCGI